MRRADQPTLAATIRRTIYEFFVQERSEGEQLITSLRWFLFRRCRRPIDDSLEETLERCPYDCGHGRIAFRFDDAPEKPCPMCSRLVYLTDTFRLHECIDEDIGSAGITAYLMTMLE